MATLKKFGMSYEGNCLEKPLKICHVFYTIFDFFFSFHANPVWVNLHFIHNKSHLPASIKGENEKEKQHWVFLYSSI